MRMSRKNSKRKRMNTSDYGDEVMTTTYRCDWCEQESQNWETISAYFVNGRKTDVIAAVCSMECVAEWAKDGGTKRAVWRCECDVCGKGMTYLGEYRVQIAVPDKDRKPGEGRRETKVDVCSPECVAAWVQGKQENA